MDVALTLSPDALLKAAMEGNTSSACSPLGGPPHILIELEASIARLHEAELAAVAQWLSRQACPVIGVTAGGLDHPLGRACDVVLSHGEEVQAVADNIAHAPLAAMVLVQLLRCTAGMDVERALIVESLAYATLQAGAEFRGWLAENPALRWNKVVESGPPVALARRSSHLDLRLNRPARRNAISIEMRDALVEALELVAADSSIQSVTISGEGKCFSAGGDLAEFGTLTDPATAHAVRSVRSPPAMLARCAERVTFRVHGASIGAGVELAAFGRTLEATPDAFFQLPEIRFGLIPGSGGCVSIPRRIGRQRTAYLALSARRLEAATALSWGLVDALVDDIGPG